MKDCTKNNG